MGEARLLLAIESSTTAGSVALGGPDGVIGEFFLNVRGAHSAALMPAADQLLRSAGVSPRDLAGVVVGAGPGSFTGIRIAGATAKGIAHALSLPMYAYSSLMAAAASAVDDGIDAPICAMFDARGRDVFAAAFRFDAEAQTLFGPETLEVDQAIDRCRSSGVGVITGDGVLRHREELVASGIGRVIPADQAFPRASDLIWLGRRFPRTGRVADPAAWEPTYLRPSGAERIGAERVAQQRNG